MRLRLGLAVLVGAVAMIAAGSASSSSNLIFFACINKDGSIKIAGIGTSPPKAWDKTCGKKAKLTQWNQVSGTDGVTGITGPTGDQGPNPQGPAGPQGVTGVTGTTGNTGDKGPVGATGPAAPNRQQSSSGSTMAPGDTLSDTTTCAGPNETMTGGGINEIHEPAAAPAVVHSYEDPPGTWNGEVVNGGSTGGVTITVYALCSTQPS